MTRPIHTDDGANQGLRTRYFRDVEDGTGVEWIYAVDHAGGRERWYAFLAAPGASIAHLKASGMTLCSPIPMEHAHEHRPESQAARQS